MVVSYSERIKGFEGMDTYREPRIVNDFYYGDKFTFSVSLDEKTLKKIKTDYEQSKSQRISISWDKIHEIFPSIGKQDDAGDIAHGKMAKGMTKENVETKTEDSDVLALIVHSPTQKISDVDLYQRENADKKTVKEVCLGESFYQIYLQVKNVRLSHGRNPSTSICVHWDAIERVENQTLAYRVCIQNKEKRESREIVTTEQEVKVNGLKPGTTYSVTVAAAGNLSRYGKISDEKEISTTLGKLKKLILSPYKTSPSDSLTLTFKPAEGEAMSYIGSLVKSSNGQTVFGPVNLSSGFLFKGLEANTAYYAKVYAVYKNGQEMVSESLERRTAPEKPVIVYAECCDEQCNIVEVKWKTTLGCDSHEVLLKEGLHGSVERRILIQNGNSYKHVCDRNTSQCSVQVRSKNESEYFGKWSDQKIVSLAQSHLKPAEERICSRIDELKVSPGKDPTMDISITWKIQDRCDTYEVLIRKDGCAEVENYLRVFNKNICHYRCHNPGQTYIVQVRYVCETVLGEWSKEHFVNLVQDIKFEMKMKDALNGQPQMKMGISGRTSKQAQNALLLSMKDNGQKHQYFSGSKRMNIKEKVKEAERPEADIHEQQDVTPQETDSEDKSIQKDQISRQSDKQIAAPDVENLPETSIFVSTQGIVQHNIRYKFIARSLSSGRKKFVDSLTPSAVISDINPGDEYEISVVRILPGRLIDEIIARSSIKTCKTITNNGGTVSVNGCTLIIPPGAVKNNAQFSVSYKKSDNNISKLPSGVMQICSVVELWSSVKSFSKPVTCEVQTWCVAHKGALNVSVLRFDGNEWVTICTSDVSEDGKVKFSCIGFSDYIIVDYTNGTKRVRYRMCSYLYYDKHNNFQWIACFDGSSLRVKCQADMENSRYKLSPLGPQYFLMVREECVSCQLKCENPQKDIYDWTFELNDEFIDIGQCSELFQLKKFEEELQDEIKLVYMMTKGGKTTEKTFNVEYPLKVEEMPKQAQHVTALNAVLGGTLTYTAENSRNNIFASSQ